MRGASPNGVRLAFHVHQGTRPVSSKKPPLASSSLTVAQCTVAAAPSSGVFIAVHRAGAERPSARGILEIPGASHAVGVSNPEAVAFTILDAVSATVPAG